jgi:predicted TIM-barrel fold metal-dependent hydrolase
MIVDIHAHYFPKEYNDILLRIGGRSLPEAARPSTARPMRNDDPSGIPTRLQQMDDAGVQMQVLSPAASPPYAEKEADAVEAARLINDTYAELAQKYPARFNAVVSLPLPHIDASADGVRDVPPDVPLRPRVRPARRRRRQDPRAQRAARPGPPALKKGSE